MDESMIHGDGQIGKVFMESRMKEKCRRPIKKEEVKVDEKNKQLYQK